MLLAQFSVTLLYQAVWSASVCCWLSFQLPCCIKQFGLPVCVVGSVFSYLVVSSSLVCQCLLLAHKRQQRLSHFGVGLKGMYIFFVDLERRSHEPKTYRRFSFMNEDFPVIVRNELKMALKRSEKPIRASSSLSEVPTTWH